MKSHIRILSFALAGMILISIPGNSIAQPPAVYTWQTLAGPNRPHEVLDLAIGKDAGGQKIYATDVDLVKLSTNAAGSWNTIGQLLTAPVIVACRADIPANALVAKFHQGGSSTDGIFYTSNSGGTWLAVPPTAPHDFQPQRIVISTPNPTLAFLGTERDNPTGTPRQTSLWRSTFGGANWEPVDYFKTTAYTFVNDVLPYPSTGYQDYVWVGGSTLDVVEPPSAASEGNTSAPQTKGVWRSIDAGVSWTPYGDAISSTDKNVTALAISINGSDQLLFAVTTNKVPAQSTEANIYQSNDLGVTWVKRTTLPSGTTQVRSLKVSPANYQLLLAGTDNGLVMSTDRGGTWTSQNAGLPAGAYNVHQVSFDLNDQTGSTAYLATGTSVYKGTYANGAWGWSERPTGTDLLNATSLSVRSGKLLSVSTSWTGVAGNISGSWQILTSMNGFLGQSTDISKTSSSRFFVGGSLNNRGVIFTSSDNGAVWLNTLNPTQTNTTFNTIVSDAKTSSSLVFSGLGGTGVGTVNFFKSSDNGVTWNNGIAVVTSGGNPVSGVPINVIAVDQSTGTSSSTTIYAGAGGSNGGVYGSTDGGSTFAFKALNGTSINAIALNGSTTTLGATIYVGTPTGIWKTTNRFSTINQLATPFTGAKRILMHPSYPNSSNFLWVVTADGQKIYRTVDGGATWGEVPTASIQKPINDLKSDLADVRNVYAATLLGVYKINPPPEGPYNFQIISGGGMSGPEFGDRPDPGGCEVHPILIWSSNQESDISTMQNNTYQIYKTSDPGYWPSSPFITIDITETSYLDLAECFGGETAVYYKMSTRDDVGNWSDFSPVKSNLPQQIIARPLDVTGIPKEYSLGQNYPNPFNPMTTFTYDLPQDGFVRLSIIDVLGREAALVVNEFQTAGNFSVEYDASTLPSGIYFYKFSSGKFSDIKKMMLMK